MKYFLAPMQDATFYGVRQTIKIARAILVFAGGIYHSFEQFDPSSEYRLRRVNEDEKARQERQRVFREQKGPDFVSRLRGHINIKAVDAEEEKGPKPLIRRAIILRGLMEKRGLLSRIENDEVAEIDQDVLYALLMVDRYRHGARSMEAILNMCAPIERKIGKASLPSAAQLNMHIDAEAFFARVYRARFRTGGTCVARAKTVAPEGDMSPAAAPPAAPTAKSIVQPLLPPLEKTEDVGGEQEPVVGESQ